MALGVGMLLAAAPAGIAAAGTAGNAEPAFDPVSPGEVAVVAESAPVRRRVAFVVQNGTERAVRVTEVTAIAQRPDGAQAVRSSTRDVVPRRLAPGEVAIGEVVFRAAAFGPGAPPGPDAAATITWKVKWGRVPGALDPLALAVGAFELSPPRSGAVVQTLDLDVTNPNDRLVRGTVDVTVLCLNEARQPVLVSGAELDDTKLRPGASVRATVEFRELCPSYVAAASVQAPR